MSLSRDYSSGNGLKKRGQLRWIRLDAGLTRVDPGTKRYEGVGEFHSVRYQGRWSGGTVAGLWWLQGITGRFYLWPAEEEGPGISASAAAASATDEVVAGAAAKR